VSVSQPHPDPAFLVSRAEELLRHGQSGLHRHIPQALPAASHRAPRAAWPSRRFMPLSVRAVIRRPASMSFIAAHAGR
jgi:hypothetical protein